MSSSRPLPVGQRQAALAVAFLLTSTTPGLEAAAVGQTSRPQGATAGKQQLVQPNATLVQRLRRLLNLSPPLAVGGSRSGSGISVCLLSPWPTSPATAQKPAVAAVPTTAPTLLPAGPLNEIQILRGNRIAWQRRASSTDPISGPIPWPLEPLQPSEEALLRLRPRGSAGGDFAELRIQAPSPNTWQRYQLLRAELIAQPSLWPAAIEAELGRNPALAVALATDPQAPLWLEMAWQGNSGCQMESAR